MSGYVSGLVWRADIPRASLTEKAVLSLYGDIGHDDGTHIYQSKSTVADRAQTSIDTVKRVTKWLLRSGLFIVVAQGAGGAKDHTTEYRIDLNILRALAGDLGDGAKERATAKIENTFDNEHVSDGVQNAPGADSTRCKSHPGANCTTKLKTLSPLQKGPPKGGPKKVPPKPVRKRSVALPADSPTLADRKWAETYWGMHRPELAAQTDEIADQFRDHHAAKGSTFIDWSKAWCTWARHQVRFAGGSIATATTNNTWTPEHWRAALRSDAAGRGWDADWPPRERCPPDIAKEFAVPSLFETEEKP